MANSFNDGVPASGASTAYNTDYIGNLNTSELLTEAEIKKLLKGVNQKITAIIHEGGPGGVMPYEEKNAETGFRVDPVAALRALQEEHDRLMAMLNDPNYVPAKQLYSQWDNPGI